MGDAPNLVWLLLAGVLPLMALRDRLLATARGRRLFAALVILYLAVAGVAVVALLTRGTPAPPAPRDLPLVGT